MERKDATEQKGRTRKRFPNHSSLAQKPPLGFNLIYHLSARLIDEDGVQRRVLLEHEFHNHRVSQFESYQCPDRGRTPEQTDGQSEFDGGPKARGTLMYSYAASRCAVDRGASKALRDPIPAGVQGTEALLRFGVKSRGQSPASAFRSLTMTQGNHKVAADGRSKVIPVPLCLFQMLKKGNPEAVRRLDTALDTGTISLLSGTLHRHRAQHRTTDSQSEIHRHNLKN